MREMCEVLSFKWTEPLSLEIARHGKVVSTQSFFNNWSSEEDRHHPSS